MLFNSVQFLIFLPIVAIVYFIIPYKVRYIWLLVTSYYFYMCWNPRYAVLMAVSTLITWGTGFFIAKGPGKEQGHNTKQKLWVAASFVTNLLILFFFKYFDFTVDTINSLLTQFHMQIVQPKFDVLLPVGISFYTFQALSYTVDVYRGDVKPERNPFKYALFVSFFPQLVAGPIERSKNLLDQLFVKHDFNYTRVKNALLLMGWGFFKKMVIADKAAILVDEVYSHYAAYGSIQIIIATVLFAVQIYCDFSGYTDIAIGTAKIFDIDLMKNFRQPYLSRSVQVFWKRWHISLSTWFRDYLYIPLGGSRKGKVRKYINTMITFLVSGLWHGASWSFVIWGGLNGLYQVVGEITKPVRKRLQSFFRINTNCTSYRLFQTAVTFMLVCFTWIFFRADGTNEALGVIRQLFSVWNPWALFDQSLYTLGLVRSQFWLLIVCIFLLYAVDIYHEKNAAVTLRGRLAGQNVIFRWLVYFGAVFFILYFGVYGTAYSSAQFIYFQF